MARSSTEMKYPENKTDTTFSEKQASTLISLEDDSWWFQYRAEVIIYFMQKYFNRDELTVDIGGGNGYTTFMAMKHGFNMMLLEPSKSEIVNAKRRGIRCHCGSLMEDYPDEGEYRQIMLLDVLEHIEGDKNFLDLLYRKLDRGVFTHYRTGLYVSMEFRR